MAEVISVSALNQYVKTLLDAEFPERTLLFFPPG